MTSNCNFILIIEKKIIQTSVPEAFCTCCKKNIIFYVQIIMVITNSFNDYLYSLDIINRILQGVCKKTKVYTTYNHSFIYTSIFMNIKPQFYIRPQKLFLWKELSIRRGHILMTGMDFFGTITIELMGQRGLLLIGNRIISLPE